MRDIQNEPDNRNVAIDKVGVKDIRYPVTVRDKTEGVQRTVASINMYVNLPHSYKGTHMSRFIELLAEFSDSKELDLHSFKDIMEEMKTRLNAESAHLEMSFPYFISKSAPVSGASGLMEYNCTFTGSANGKGERDMIVQVSVPITTLCPCSKEISDSGAHNQRGEVRVAIRYKSFFWIEDLIAMIESCASSPVYSVLKREDEKEVTEAAYDNPKFVEDVVREVALKLLADDNVTWFAVDTENFESIHNHSAYAYIERDKRQKRA